MIPILMDDTKSLQTLVSSRTNGIGRLSEIISATIFEERNGLFDMTFDIPVTAKHFDKLKIGGIVKAKASEKLGNQLFRVYKVSKPLNGIVTVDLHHITYDLGKTAVLPFTATGAPTATIELKNHLIGEYPFTIYTDIQNSTSKFELTIPRPFRQCLGGYEGSLLDVFGGEYEWDNLEVKLLANRGTDNGVKIKYGKNLVDLRQEENNENVYTAVLGYALYNEITYTGDVQYAVQGSSPKVLTVDFTSSFEAQEPTKERLNQLALDYIQNNNILVPKVNLEVSFVSLSQTDQYKSIAILERVSLCDTVTIEFDKLGVDATAKVIKTEWDVINERYNSIELGESRATLSTQIQQTSEQLVKESTSVLESSIEHATNMITGGLGGYVVIRRNASGQPEEILIMDTDSTSTAVNVIRMNKNGIGFSTNGVEGPYRSAWTIDGKFTADNISGGTMSAGSIEGIDIRGATIIAGVLESTRLIFGEDPNTTELRTNDAKTGALFDGTGVMQFNTKGEFYAKNIFPNNYLANTLRLYTSNSTDSYVNLSNYKINSNSSTTTANQMLFSSSSTYSNASFTNYRYDQTLAVAANGIYLYSNQYNNQLQIVNNDITETTAKQKNRIALTSSSSGTANIELYNYKGMASYTTQYFNRLSLDVNSTTSTSTLTNYVRETDNFPSNALSLTSNMNATSNTASLTNYKYKTNNVANQILFGHDTSYSYTRVYNNQYNNTSYANTMLWQSVPSGANSLYLENYQPGTNGHKGNQIVMNSSSTTPSLQINNFQLNSNNVNSQIVLNGSISLTAQNWLYIRLIGGDRQIVINANGVDRYGYTGTKNGCTFQNGICVG